MNTSKTFARPSLASTISVHFFPVLQKFSTWNDHFSVIKTTWTHRREFEFSFLALTPQRFKFSSRVALVAFKNYTNWDNDEKDWQTWICSFKRRFPYRRVVDLKLLNKIQESAHMKLVETDQDIPENNSIPIKGRPGAKFFTIQNDKQKKGCYFIFNN